MNLRMGDLTMYIMIRAVCRHIAAATYYVGAKQACTAVYLTPHPAL